MPPQDQTDCAWMRKPNRSIFHELIIHKSLVLSHTLNRLIVAKYEKKPNKFQLVVD